MAAQRTDAGLTGAPARVSGRVRANTLPASGTAGDEASLPALTFAELSGAAPTRINQLVKLSPSSGSALLVEVVRALTKNSPEAGAENL